MSLSEMPCTNVISCCNGKKSEIMFCFSVKNSYFGSKYVTICKDVDSDQIYFNNKNSDKSFVEKHFDRISETFSTLENFSKLYQGGVGNCGSSIKQIITDGFIHVHMESDTYGRTTLFTSLTKEEDKESMFNREWYQRKTLKEIYQENEDLILRKIPVQIESLNPTYKTIVTDAISKMNVPVLSKKK